MIIDFNRFVDNILKESRNIRSSSEPLVECAKFLSPKYGGLYLEFGVYSGSSITKINNILSNWGIYGFDSFEGLPEKWRDGYEKGCFSLGKRIPLLHPNINLVPGWFDTSIPKWLRERTDHQYADLLHIDCDIYSSTQTIFKLLDTLILPQKTLLVFDELIEYPGFENHEIKALYEYCESKQYSVEILYAGGNDNEKVALKLKNNVISEI